jgi:hypothetical protein
MLEPERQDWVFASGSNWSKVVVVYNTAVSLVDGYPHVLYQKGNIWGFVDGHA